MKFAECMELLILHYFIRLLRPMKIATLQYLSASDPEMLFTKEIDPVK